MFEGIRLNGLCRGVSFLASGCRVQYSKEIKHRFIAGISSSPLNIRPRSFSGKSYSLCQEATASSSSTGFESAAGSNDRSNKAEDEEEFQIKLKILQASLNHVPEKGFSSNALKAGAQDMGLSEAISTLCTPYDLVEYFQRFSNYKLENHLRGQEIKEKSLYSSVEYRLRLVLPYVNRYHEAMGISLEPANIPRSLQVLRELSDIICVHGLGDKSTDLRWYTKRSGVISLYVATECCMIQDKSDGFLETWDFLQRRVKDYQFCENAGSSALPFVESGFTTLMNIFGMNRKR